MEVVSYVDLKPFQTFKVDVQARYFFEFSSLNGLIEGLNFQKKQKIPYLILGGGSNILFTQNFEGIVLKNYLKGKEIIQENAENIWIKVQSGENWHEFVSYCVENQWNGIENLALIPGTVGAAPIQNIGAYGKELKDVLESLEAFHIPSQEVHTFYLSDCELGYRDSVFKRKYKNQYVILSVTLKLNKKPVLNFSYSDVQKYLETHQLTPSIKNIYDAVVSIRKEKLPDPAIVGNAGSFFKNPYVTTEKYHSLKKDYFHLPSFFIDEKTVKIPAAWLIEQCGWKGFREKDLGVHPKQPLVLVNYGNAKGKEIYELAQKIMQSVKQKFDIDLEPEVNIL
ncbi:MAG: UDP-N-acetylenolpyruvoylglucosamine reductase [Bacteroidia bacterium]|nr:MAG: UDP-N-acetylenolpyruvoylglucosamine reductase [Bacteroidia bacterium]